MFFGIRFSALCVIMVILSAFAAAVDQDSRAQLGLFQRKPTGPYYCKARCVALCLESDLSKNVESCEKEFCSNFDEDTPCPRSDTECWTNCGRRLEGPTPSPPPVENVQAEFDQSPYDIDPYTMQLTWEPQNESSLYIVEIFPIKTGLGADEEKIVQVMTQGASYQFHKPDLCETYMARIMAVTGQGMSAPRYRRLNGVTQSLEDIDLHVAPASMSRSSQDPYPVKVIFKYEMPSTWKRGDVAIAETSVRAFDCSEEIDRESGFTDTKPDTDGFYWPLVFVNIMETEIRLSFPVDVLYPKCKFVFKVSSLTTRCGFKATVAEDNKRNEVPFAMNCQTVENANCAQREPSSFSEDTLKVMIEPREPPIDGSGSGQLRPYIFGKPTKTAAERPNEDSQMPASPWDAQVAQNNDTLSRMFQSFMRGFGDGVANETKSRKRIMAEAPVVQIEKGSRTPLPPAPNVPQDVQPSSDEDQAFEKAFEESLDGQSETLEPIPQPSEPPIHSEDSTDVPITKDHLTTTENPRFRVFKEPAGNGLSQWFSPAQNATTSQTMAFVCMICALVFFVVFILWFALSRRSRRKEHAVV